MIAYTSGNETIIQPVGVKDNSGLLSVINVIIGLAIGAAVMWFLVMPAQQQRTNEELNQAVADYSEQLDSRTAALETLQSEMSSLESRTQEAEEASSQAAEQLSDYESLLNAYALYTQDDAAGALEALQQIDRESLGDNAGTLYDTIFADVGTQAVDDLYATGYAAYESGDYETAINDLSRCYELDNTRANALYFLARAYHRSGDTENARIYYQRVIDEQPGTRWATDAAGLLAGL